jgi:hypothetical protein
MYYFIHCLSSVVSGTHAIIGQFSRPSTARFEQLEEQGK